MGKTLLSNNVDAEVCFTNSECFPDGSALEQISISGKSDSPTLLLQTKKTNRIAPEIVYRGRTYRPALPSSEIGKSILLPDGVKGYDSAGRLFNQLSKVFIKFCALPELQAALLASWVISTWFADQMFNPPTLWIIGADVIRVMHLFEILRRLCRRPLTLTGLTSARLSSLPMALHPTLLVSAPGSSVLKTLLESNFRDLLVPGPEGVAQDLRCAKAVYTGTKDLPRPWMDQVIQLPLSPLDDGTARRATEQDLAKLQSLFQPRLLQYRLDHWQAARDSGFVATGLRPETRELANALAACIPTDEKLVRQLPSLLAAQDDDALCACSLDTAILEVLWPRIHRQSDGTSQEAEMKMKAEFTANVNTYLLAAGETQEFTAEMVGKRTVLLGLAHRRTKHGSHLLLNPQTSRRIHQLARNLEPEKRVEACTECERIVLAAK